MKIEDIAELLVPWIKLNTWNTTHPSDLHNFHQVVNKIISQSNNTVSSDDFSLALENKIDEYYPDYTTEHKENLINTFKIHFEHITNYLRYVDK